MKYISVWCEYDIDVYAVPDDMTAAEINQKIEDRFSDLFNEIKDEDDESFLDTGLICWRFINITQL